MSFWKLCRQRLSPGKSDEVQENTGVQRLIRWRTIRMTASSGEWLGLEHVGTICESGMRYSDIPRHCNLQRVHVHVIYCSDVHTSPTAKQNEGLLNQDHKFWNKSFARSRVPFRICQGMKRRCSQKKTSCLAQRWRSSQRPGLWQEQCDSSSLVSGWGPSNSNKIKLFRRKRRTSCKKNKSRTSQPILTLK